MADSLAVVTFGGPAGMEGGATETGLVDNWTIGVLQRALRTNLRSALEKEV